MGRVRGSLEDAGAAPTYGDEAARVSVLAAFPVGAVAIGGNLALRE